LQFTLKTTVEAPVGWYTMP